MHCEAKNLYQMSAGGRINTGNSLKILLLSLISAAFWAGSAGAQFCPVGDLNGDRTVNYKDLQILAAQWLNPNCLSVGCDADLDGNSKVNMADLAILSDNWGINKVNAVISEFMASNDSKEPLEDGELLDEDGDSSDWIEIYNPTNKPINLDGWYLKYQAGRRQHEGVAISVCAAKSGPVSDCLCLRERTAVTRAYPCTQILISMPMEVIWRW